MDSTWYVLLLGLSIVVVVSHGKFVPGTFFLPITVSNSTIKGGLGTLVSQYSLITGLNYTAPLLGDSSDYNYFLAPQDSLLFVLSTAKDSKINLITYDYSSNIPFLKNNCELPFASINDLPNVFYSNQDVYVGTASGSLYILSSTCDYKLVMSIPQQGIEYSSNPIVDEASSTLYYANKTHFIKILIPAREITTFEFPQHVQMSEYYQLLIGQTTGDIYMLVSARILYSVEVKESSIVLSVVCNNSTCDPSVQPLDLVGVDDRYMQTLGPVFITMKGLLTPIALTNGTTLVWSGPTLTEVWSGYSAAGFGAGMYDQSGEIFV